MKRLGCLALFLAAPVVAFGSEVPDAKQFEPASWSPYLVGALLGALTWLTFYFSDKPVGASSFYATIAGKLGMLIAPKHTKGLAYFKENPPKFGWEAVFVLATIIGGFAAAITGSEFNNQWLPDMWVVKFGSDSLPLRAASALGGGILMAFGARMAGGCTSGHGISGTL
jgi:uncharacterized membrane protein YedE/YeeE